MSTSEGLGPLPEGCLDGSAPLWMAIAKWSKARPGNASGAAADEIDAEFTRLMRSYALQERAAERERWAKAFEAWREKTLAAQEGPSSELANVMLRQLAELGFGECARALKANAQDEPEATA